MKHRNGKREEKGGGIVDGEGGHGDNSGWRLVACRGQRTVCKYGGVKY